MKRKQMLALNFEHVQLSIWFRNYVLLSIIGKHYFAKLIEAHPFQKQLSFQPDFYSCY